MKSREPVRWERLVYVVVALCICAVPFVGMLWTGSGDTAEESSVDPVPALVDSEGNPDIGFARRMSVYFENHFAYRSLAVDAYGRLSAGIFATSTTEQVVVGTDGWLYYGGTLDDFLATDPLSEREADNIVHNLTLMQGYTEAMGATFIFAVAPNKNSLYPENMPFYLMSGDNGSMALLTERMDAAGIGFLDLFARFKAEERVLYYKTDSHWNYEGALLVSDAMLDMADRDPVKPLSRITDGDFVGDIERMLYPVTASPEVSLTIDAGEWDYADGADSVEDVTIRTESDGKGSLLMYRDSFANNLIPLLSPSFESCHYTKLIPYDLTLVARDEPDVVIIERAERHVALLAENPPIMPAPMLSLEEETIGNGKRAVSLVSAVDGDFIVIEGRFDPDPNVTGEVDEIYLEVETANGEAYFMPFRLNPTHGGAKSDGEASGDGATTADANDSPSENTPLHSDSYGFKAYIPASVFEGGERFVNVLVQEAQGSSIIRVDGITISPS